MRTNSGWDSIKKRSNNIFNLPFNFFVFEFCPDQSDTAIDIVPYPSRRNHTCPYIYSCHSSYRETISPVDIWHCHGITNNARQAGHILYLFYALIFQNLFQKLLTGIYPSWNLHSFRFWDLPRNIIYLF